ncbi:MAG: LacI family DNA-binding transcriptional regulator [Lachnospiraceae bacterium]|nr:LacI family DNA-binding transcriptional regulator [Lachnospiraceae bacterium]
MATIYDIARYVGVSKSTVSSVLNKDPRVKEETRVRVEDAIRELGYVRNSSAVSLSKQITKTIGIVSAVDKIRVAPYEAENEVGRYSMDVRNSIFDQLADTDYSVITERCFFPGSEGLIPRIIKSGRVDGVILISSKFEQEIIDKIRRLGVPVVGIGARFGGIDMVSPDYRGGTYLATKELIQSGCRNIVLFNAPERYKEEAIAARREGWSRAIAEYQGDDIRYTEIPSPAISGGGGYLAMKELWEKGLRPDGITTANEMIALGAIRFLNEQGVKVPDDVSVVAFEASDLGGCAVTPVTAIDICKRKIGAKAVELLIRRIENPQLPIEKHVIESVLLPRASVIKRW